MNTPTKDRKIAMRSTLRRLRQDYVLQHADEVERECATLTKYAQELVELHAKTLYGDYASNPATKVVIASFKPHSSEINPGHLEQALKKLGHDIVWPRVEGKNLKFLSADQASDFVLSSFGLLEPGPSATERVPSHILMPLLGFDGQGQRLGQGGGFYDRTLKRLGANVLAIGLSWDCQEVANIPVEAHDMPIAGVITPSTFHHF